jgi:microsomal dipeptidase-like Zn-dependent dipeptidase
MEVGVTQGARSRAGVGWLVAAVAAVAALLGTPERASADEPTRYSLAGGCYALRSESGGAFVGRERGAYRAAVGRVAEAEVFRMQATTLGRYLLYGSGRDFLALDGGEIAAAAEPSDDADWTVRESGDAFTIANESAGRRLAVGADGRLIAGEPERFAFVAARGCPQYPEVDLNVRGRPVAGKLAYGEVSGLLEGHMHGMAFEFLGGRAHCGRPWHRFGAPYALVDCPDHQAGNGCAAVLENALYGEPVRCHDPVGWPTFKDWPHHQSLTHEQSYYRWLERAWRGGLRLYVNLMVENRGLCELYPLKQNSCNEMDSVLLQIQRIHEMQDYIDAQAGGPGKGFFRIVNDPFEARRVINQGKLAVVQGMEVSEPFGCRLQFGAPTCTEAEIDGWLDRLDDLGVRQLEITNKFDNALTGVAGDNGTTGTVVNAGNFYTTGRFWDLEHCDDAENHDHSPTGVEVHNDDAIVANGFDAFAPPGALPVYPEGPHCNTLGLSALGEHAVRQIMREEMIFDPDHMSVLGRNQALNLVESQDYSGIISSHSWSTPNALPRIYRLGGVVTPYAGGSESFVHQWTHLRDAYSGRQYFGVGYGADMNGFGAQGGPRGAGVANPVRYPFESFDGRVTIDRQTSGERVFDINTDGVAHYGLYPDWVEDLRMLAGERIVRDMGRGAEAYLQMWERATGIPEVSCNRLRQRFLTPRGFAGRVQLGQGPRRVLERAGQPLRRTRTWTWCAASRGAAGKQAGKPRVVAVFTRRAKVGLILSTLRKHRAAGVRVRMPARRLRGRAEPIGGGLFVRDAGRGRRFVYGTRGGRVSFVAVASRPVAGREGVLRRHLARARR